MACTEPKTIFVTLETKYNLRLIEQAKDMRIDQNETCFTLVEMLIVVAMVVILTTMVIGLAGRIDNQSKEQLTKNTIGIITAALRQFRDYKYRYEAPIYAGFDFPLDCNDFPQPAVEMTLGNALGATVAIGGAPDIRYSGCEALYFLLNQVPECRKTLDKIDESLLTNLDSNKQPRNISVTFPGGVPKVYPLLRVIDPWGITLKYDYYDEVLIPPDPRQKRSFPVITSAGPDRKFGPGDAGDDISSRK